MQLFIGINRKKNPATTYNFPRLFLTQKFHCHKMFLAMSSPVFEAMFYGGLAETAREIKILDVQPDAFAALLDYIYTDQLQLNSFELVCDICYAAKKYMLPDLGKGLLCFFLCKIFLARLLIHILQITGYCNVLFTFIMLWCENYGAMERLDQSSLHLLIKHPETDVSRPGIEQAGTLPKS